MSQALPVMSMPHRPEPPAELLARCEPKILPGYWVEDIRGADGVRYVNPKQRLSLIWSVAQEGDGKWWQHISVAHPARLPTWDELVTIKEWLIGRDVDAYQVIPKRSNYVNIHPNCLHLFRCLEGDVLPDFTDGSGSL